MRRTLGGLALVTFLVSPARTGRADEPAHPLAAVPLPKLPDLPPVSVPEPTWRKSEPVVKFGPASDPYDPPKTLPDIPKKPPAPLAGGKKSEPIDVPRPTDPPADPKKLKDEVENLLRERELLTKPAGGDTATSDERARLKAQMDALLKKLGEQGKKPAKPTEKPADHGTKPASKFDVPADGGVLDPVRVAANLYKDGDVDAALRVLAPIKDSGALTAEDRVFAKYLTACCQRRTGKVAEATKLFREIADAKEDQYLAECALWQISAIRSTQELETQLGQLRSRNKTR